jgi:hypothetical protein
VADVKAESPGASSGGISVRQRPGEARVSADESVRRGFREISQKPGVFGLDEIFTNDRMDSPEAGVSPVLQILVDCSGEVLALVLAVPLRVAVCSERFEVASG